MGPSVHAVKLNNTFLPKYVWDENTQSIRPGHEQLVHTLVDTRQSA